MRRVFALALIVFPLACRSRPHTPPAPRVSRVDGGAPTAASARPPFPASTLSTNARRDCFDESFQTTRLRLRGTLLELCGIVGGAPRCFEIDPIANRVEQARVEDAPAVATMEVRLDGPFQRTELASHGWRVTTRGGSLSVTGPAGNHRSVPAQNFGFHSYENTVLLPWTDGWYAVMVGLRGLDLGATAVIDPFTLRMISHSAVLPCGRDS